MDVSEGVLCLTVKGSEELRDRTHKLDFTARNVLFLIELGSTTAEAILQRSIFPRDTVIDRLRRLLGNKFVAVAPGDGARSGGSTTPDFVAGPAPERPRLEFGVSVSQARFALTDFCLDQFGTQGQDLVDALSRCGDVASLQQALHKIRAEVLIRFPGRLPLLAACVREINATDSEAVASPAPVAPDSDISSAPEHLRLEAGVSLTQARFALSDFCLEQFGVQGQDLVVAVDRCVDVAGLQKVVNRIRAEVDTRRRDSLPILLVCVREINESAIA